MTEALAIRPVDATALIADMGARARAAAVRLASAPTAEKAAALREA
jgi:glutamate-5-semialdehyde dehydrogenase